MKKNELFDNSDIGDGAATVAKLRNFLATINMVDIPEITFQSDLNRTRIAQQSGFSKSCFSSNSLLLSTLLSFENKCRSKGWLPEIKTSSLAAEADQYAETKYEQTTKNQQINNNRLRKLEQQITAKDTEIRILKTALRQYQSLEELRDVIAEMGIMPR